MNKPPHKKHFNQLKPKVLLMFLFNFLFAINTMGLDGLSRSDHPAFLGGVNIRFPYGFSFFHEQHLFKGITLKADAGTGIGYSRILNQKTEYNFYPTFSLQPRWYYNLNKRADAGKNIAGFSANYIAVRNGYSIAEFRNSVDFSLKWGMRRVLYKKFYFEFEAGIAKYYGLKSSEFSSIESFPIIPMLTFGFGAKLY